MTSDPGAVGRDQLYVWAWLPGSVEPVVAGVLTRGAGILAGQPVLSFTYARSYRDRPGAIPLFTPELPLRPGTFDPSVADRDHLRSPLPIFGCLRDAAPDAWGRRIINLRLAGDPDAELSELSYLGVSGSDRIGALDFQGSATEYVARGERATLDQLLRAAELVESGQAIPDDLVAAAAHGTSIGGARPKALLEDDGRHLIAKFSSTTDTRPVVKAEAVAMILAARAGIQVAPVELRDVDGRDVLLVERFDRGSGGTRKLMVSALTILGLSELESRYGSYAEIAEAVRTGPWVRPADTLRELFTRMVFNVCIGNNDDHLRNHAAFWDGDRLELTPAYDLAPQPRSTGVSTQAIGIARDGRRASQLWLCREVAPTFLLSAAAAEQIIDHLVTVIRAEWAQACDEAAVTGPERDVLWGREFLNPYIFYSQP